MKKKILILGYSNFVQRRVLKSLKKINGLEIYICSKSHDLDNKKKILFNDYESALSAKKFDFVYISLINILHYKYALKALKKGFNVIVDKPISIQYSHTEKLLEIAKNKKLFLYELTVFNYHIVYNKILEILGGKNKIESIHANFNIPQNKSLKSMKLLKNSCDYDMAPYAASIIRIFFSKNFKINKIIKNFYNKPYKKIVKNFSFLISFKEKVFFGNFAVSKEYISNIIFFSKDKIIEVPHQAFALPCNKYINLILKHKNRKVKIRYKNDYIQDFFSQILNNKYSKNYFYRIIEEDNKIKKKLGLLK
jgi:predicted dehydrogenase